MSQTNLVQRLIAFLKRPDALEYEKRQSRANTYDDYGGSQASYEAATGPSEVSRAPEEMPMEHGSRSTYAYGSRLDALVMRALQQFNAPLGFVVRYDREGKMRYLTGRNMHGHFVPHTDVRPDRRAMFLTLDSGESQLFVHNEGESPLAVLCGPLLVNNQVVGLLYLDNPARSRLHRGVFDVYCDQAARMVQEYVM